MMGILFLLAAVAGVLVSLIAGWGGFALARRAFTAGASGWPFFWALAVAVFLVLAAAIVAWLVLADRGTPPQAADFTRLFKAAFLFGAAPGAGLLAAGLFTALK